MGANLSSTFIPDTSKDVLSAPDAFADMLLLGLWAGAIYGIGMIWTTCALIDRWRGPRDNVRVSGASALVATVLSAVWPVVLLYLLMSS